MWYVLDQLPSYASVYVCDLIFNKKAVLSQRLPRDAPDRTIR